MTGISEAARIQIEAKVIEILQEKEIPLTTREILGLLKNTGRGLPAGKRGRGYFYLSSLRLAQILITMKVKGILCNDGKRRRDSTDYNTWKLRNEKECL